MLPKIPIIIYGTFLWNFNRIYFRISTPKRWLIILFLVRVFSFICDATYRAILTLRFYRIFKAILPSRITRTFQGNFNWFYLQLQTPKRWLIFSFLTWVFSWINDATYGAKLPFKILYLTILGSCRSILPLTIHSTCLRCTFPIRFRFWRTNCLLIASSIHIIGHNNLNTFWIRITCMLHTNLAPYRKLFLTNWRNFSQIKVPSRLSASYAWFRTRWDTLDQPTHFLLRIHHLISINHHIDSRINSTFARILRSHLCKIIRYIFSVRNKRTLLFLWSQICPLEKIGLVIQFI